MNFGTPTQSLSRKHQIRIGCVFPEWHRFYPDIEAGINAAYNSLLDHNVNVICMNTGKLGDGKESACVEKLLELGIQGLAVCPGHRTSLNEVINSVVDKDIPVVTIATDAPESKRMTCVSTDSFNNGQIAGDLMVNFLNHKGKVSGIDVTRLKIFNYALTGFLAVLAGIIMTARLGAASVTAGTGMELKVISAVIIGGASLQGGRGDRDRILLGFPAHGHHHQFPHFPRGRHLLEHVGPRSNAAIGSHD